MMSPYRFSISSTSKWLGSLTSCMQALSTINSSYAMAWYFLATRRAHSRNSPSESFMMLALCTTVTRFRFSRAA